jgi:hypothetical protein
MLMRWLLIVLRWLLKMLKRLWRNRRGRTYDDQGRLLSVAVWWKDGVWYAQPQGAAALYDATLPVTFMGLFANIALTYYGITWLWLPWLVAAVLWGLAWLSLRPSEKPKRYRRKVIMYTDGRIRFASAAPTDGRPRPANIRIADIHSIEYRPTAEWSALDPEHYKTQFAGQWHDVYALLKDGRRYLFARNVWDRSFNHDLALLLRNVIDEVTTASRQFPAPPRTRPAAHAAAQTGRQRRVVE